MIDQKALLKKTTQESNALSAVELRRSWLQGGAEIGWDIGMAMATVFALGLVNGLLRFLPGRPQFNEGAPPGMVKAKTALWLTKKNVLQRLLYQVVLLMEKAYVRPMQWLGEKVLAPLFSSMWLTLAFFPGQIAGYWGGKVLFNRKSSWAQDLIEHHGDKLAYGSILLAAIALFFSTGMIAWLSHSLWAAVGVGILITLSPVIFCHAITAMIAALHGTWHLFSPLLPIGHAPQDEVIANFITLKIDRQIADHEVRSALQALFRGEMIQKQNYETQRTVHGEGEHRESGAILTSYNALQKDQSAFIEEVKALPTQVDQLKRIRERGRFFHTRMLRV